MTVRNKSTSLRFLALAAACSLVLAPLAAMGPAPKANAYASSDADTAIKAFNAAFWDGGAKYFRTNSKQADNYQGFWVEAELWETVMDAYLHTADPALKAQLRTQIDDVFDGTVAKYGADWTNNHFNDDIMWWAMASARAYAITQEPRYLEKAKYYFDFVYDTQWDDAFAGGGIWWMNSEHDSKNACINFPAAEAAVFLYDVTKDDRYLQAATRIYTWGKTMLTDGNGQVYDRLEVANGTAGGATHYNQGTFIGAASGLYRLTGDPTYLDDAVKAAAYTKRNLIDENGLLRFEGPNGDLKGGKTILIRNLAYLLEALKPQTDGSYVQTRGELADWLAFNAETAWSNRNPDGVVDGNWAGQLLAGTYESWSASGAVEALSVLEPRTAQVRYADKNPFNRMEAEKYNIGSGFVMEDSTDGTIQLGGIQPGMYAAYRNVDFGAGGAKGFIARAASATGGGNIEIRLDAPDGPKVGTLNVQGTGGWNNFSDAVGLLTDDQGQPSVVTGKHDVYLLFTKTNDQYLFNLNWFKFTTTDPTRTDAYARLKAGNYDDAAGLGKNAEFGFLDGITNGAHAVYRGIDFGAGAAGATFHVASGSQGGTIEVRLDGLDGPVAGTVDIPALGTWDKWVDIMGNLDDTRAKGIHDVYLVFRGANGSDYPLNLDWFTFSTVKGQARDAYGKLEAENYTTAVAVGRENGGGQTYLAGVYGPNGPYAMYNYVDFGSASPTAFTVNAASDTGGGTIEVRLDSLSGPLIATGTVTGTGGWQTFKRFTANVTTPVTGKHIVFLLFKGGDYLYNLDKFTFGDPAVFDAPTPPTPPAEDHVAPGEATHVQVVRGDNQLKLYWDGPYDTDAEKVQLALLKGSQQVGGMVEAKRGVQSAVLPGIENGGTYTVSIKSVDKAGNVSHGVLLPVDPAFALEANGTALPEGGAAPDDRPLTFRLQAGLTAVRSASITVDGRTYAVDAAHPAAELDFAGLTGAKTATIVFTDYAGVSIRQTFGFQVVTSVDAMKRLVARFQASGDLRGPLVPQLGNALDQAQHQLDGGKPKQAVKHLQDFLKHLNNPAMGKNVSEGAKAALGADAQLLIEQWT
ncbi:carbohydrate-binding protein [Paenibacillus sp. MWE-103]|uniref:Carbohydrate-binding protein n=1 Tax=Paenibacillus artemisiicola TaxID=1172618 RepID=A0ABS3WJM5_9BACL|nr:carbohydrate-binding protein [Paenibacillus artemisiicola]MBO7748477.1 carbohydrate-binding protein [Paenibacillus artemisiicola]